MNFLDLAAGASLALLATSAGAAAVLAFKRIDQRLYFPIISFCAGVMVSSSIEMVSESHAASGPAVTFGGMLLGMLAFFIVEKALPHAHLILRRRRMPDSKKKVALMAGTITLHNVPEGFAIASAFASSTPLGWLVATSIALQDIPEGLVVSVPMACYGVAMRRSFFLGVFSGVVEFAAAMFAFLFLSAVSALIPFSLAFSGGAMAYVALFELLPESLSGNSARGSMLSFILGAAAAFAMAAIFGA